MFYLSSSYACRINFDALLKQHIEEAKATGWESFDEWWAIVADQYNTDDPDEADARAADIWKKGQ
ncbi:MAG: hypothetical protein HC911_17610 [Chloroflexaceae bacterium]|nr:hypothetical protein [Chloroflexaceae bacterium]